MTTMRPPLVGGKFLLGSTDARWGEIRIPAHDHHTLADVLLPARFGGRLNEVTEDREVALAMRRCGMRHEETK
jgi:hypothetical protein